MPEIIGIALACLIVAAIAAYVIVDGIFEKKERARCRQLFVPLIGAPIKLVGQHYSKRYDITGVHHGQHVAIHCPVVSIFARSLRVLSLSVPLADKDLDPQLLAGDPVELHGRTFRKYGDQLRLILNPPLVFTPDTDPQSFRDRVAAELDALCNL
ncbi:MAG: hypothetical protein CMJ49_13945 [Planctomycetaceae bacterium]|nr:hypothetical protein [Planctomycetaceae bacterium]